MQSTEKNLSKLYWNNQLTCGQRCDQGGWPVWDRLDKKIFAYATSVFTPQVCLHLHFFTAADCLRQRLAGNQVKPSGHPNVLQTGLFPSNWHATVLLTLFLNKSWFKNSQTMIVFFVLASQTAQYRIYPEQRRVTLICSEHVRQEQEVEHSLVPHNLQYCLVLCIFATGTGSRPRSGAQNL